MTANRDITADAVSALTTEWKTINWSVVASEVRKLQVRIAKAASERKWRKVKSLQWLLTHSYSAKCMAVRKVTQNKGKKTPGIDGIILDTYEAKMAMVKSLKRRGYQPKPLRRIYIPKSNGKRRPLGIPSMLDRCQQALHTLAVLPVAETTADWNSYGFRPERCTADAIEQIFNALCRKGSPQWILEGDIKACFDMISHRWMIENICMDTAILKKWLTAGFMEKGKLFPTEAGTPQGGIASPTLANMVLDGMEDLIGHKYGSFKLDGHRRRYVKSSVQLIRYCDDFVITARSKDVLEKEVKPLISEFLSERGLQLSEEKTKVTHISEGFDFLGQNIRKYRFGKTNSRLLIKPSRKNVKTFLQAVRKTIKASRGARQENLIEQLNPKIRGWSNYHRSVVSKEIFSKVDAAIWKALYKWARSRHTNKNKSWVFNRYFKPIGLQQGRFSCIIKNEKNESRLVVLQQASKTEIRRHCKIQGRANPFNPTFNEYFENRISVKMRGSKEGKRKLMSLWKKQRGLCAVCAERITSVTNWVLHYLQSPTEGGGNALSNLCMLHPKCHRDGYKNGFTFSLPVGLK